MTEDAATVELAVNGTLMRGDELNRNVTDFGCEFVRDARTAPVYRLWSIAGRHPGMIRTNAGDGASIAVEVWRVPLADVAAVLAEPAIVEAHPEITHPGGWRAFTHTGEPGEPK